MKQFHVASAVCLAVLLAGCGGGGNSTNTPPVVQAGSDQTTVINMAVTLSGSATDSDGSISSYQWKEDNNVLGSSPTLTYTPSTLGNHTLTLTATDNSGASASDTVVVHAVPTHRDQKLLVVRINFTDKTFHSDAATWASKIFGSSSGQLNDYYNEISYGAFQFVPAAESDGVADGVVTTTVSMAHPGNDDPGNGDYHMWNVFKTALTQIDSQVDFSAFDTDGNGALSKDELQIMFLVAGGEASTGWPSGSSIWALKSCYQAPTTPAAPTHDGTVLMQCTAQGDFSRFGEQQFFSAPADATIGVIAHELGHAVFGLPDLYDADGTSGGIGDFGLMGGGSWGKKPGERPGATPVHMIGWSKIQAGFATPMRLTNTTPTSVTLKGTDRLAYQLYRVDTSVPGEYFLIENRPPSGYDLGLASLAGAGSGFTGGLSVLHIDESISDNTDPSHKLVDVQEAANAELDNPSGHNTGHINNLYFVGNQDTLPSPATQTYSGAATGFEITNISAPGGQMTADIKAQ